MRNMLKRMWRKLAVTCVAVTLLVGLFCLVKPYRMEAASAGDEQSIQQLSQALETVQSLAKQAAPYDAVFRRDPTRALVNEQGELVTSTGLHSGLAVQGIIWSDHHPLAVVDDELVAPGEVVGPYTVTEIKPDGLTAASSTDTVFVPLDRGIAPHEESQATATPAPSSNPSPAPSEASSQ